MSTYQELKGLKVKYLSSDTSGDRAIEGEVFYNSASGKVASHIAVGAWSAGSNLITGQRNGAGFGTQTALVFAAGIGPGGPAIATTQEYNGNGWSSATNYPASRYNVGGFGTLTAGAVVGGYPDINETKEYDGSSWTAGGDYPTGVYSISTHGTQTAGIAAGGGPAVTTSAIYNGSSWTATPGSLNNGRGAGGMAGTSTAAVLMGGGTGPDPGVSNATEECDGSTWTSVTNTPTNIEFQGATGSQTAAIYFAGRTPTVVNKTFTYDGTSYSAASDMGTARYALARGTLGTQTTAIGCGGYASGTRSETEEWNISTSATTAAAWASGGDLNQGRYWLGTANQGTQNASMGFGGYLTPGNTMYALTEQYDGSSWTEVGDLVLARSQMSGAGTNTAGLCIGGYVNAVGTKAETEEFDGTSWSEQGNLGTARYASGGAGTQTAGLCMSGVFYIAGQGPSQSYKAETEEYDGSSWTESGDVSTARSRVGGCGTQTAALMCGGYTPSLQTATEEYDGSSWTNGGALFTATGQLAAAGSQTAALAFGGTTGSDVATTLRYDGSSWSTHPSLGTARRGMGGTGSTSAGLAFGGAVNKTNTEEFTGETTSLSTAKTIDFD